MKDLFIISNSQVSKREKREAGEGPDQCYQLATGLLSKGLSRYKLDDLTLRFGSQPEVIRQILERLGHWEKSRPPPEEPQTFHSRMSFKNLLTMDGPAMKNPFNP